MSTLEVVEPEKSAKEERITHQEYLAKAGETNAHTAKQAIHFLERTQITGKESKRWQSVSPWFSKSRTMPSVWPIAPKKKQFDLNGRPKMGKNKKAEEKPGIMPIEFRNVVHLPPIPKEELADPDVMYLYGLHYVGQLARMVRFKVKGDKVIEKIENVETQPMLQIQRIAETINVPGYERPNLTPTGK